MDAIVARLHHQQPTFDWVGVYLLEGSTLPLGPFRGNPTEHERNAFGAREVEVIEAAAGEIAQSTVRR
jgi:putative methionine-R-sulfoxide reductase with GAF domain